MDLKNVATLNSGDYAVIDLDTGTVLGTNVVLVALPADGTFDDIDDSTAWEYGTQHGVPLFTDVE